MSGEKNCKQPESKEQEYSGGKKKDHSYGSKELSKSKSLGIIVLVGALLVFQITVFVTSKPGGRKDGSAGSGFPVKYPDSTMTAFAEGTKPFSHRNDSGKPGRYTRPSRTARLKTHPAERFVFDPNIISADSLCRLGFSPKQAQTILNYRGKGGIFRKKEDFARMYVVGEALYRELAPYIVMPEVVVRNTPARGVAVPDVVVQGRADSAGTTGFDSRIPGSPQESTTKKKWVIDLNMADSTALVKLYGIGGYYAEKILQYRTRLGSFYAPTQLMEIDGIDTLRFDGFKEHVTVDDSYIRKFSLDTAGKAFLVKHPYIGGYAARGILLLRDQSGPAACTLDNLVKEKILTPAGVARLRPYIKEPVANHSRAGFPDDF